MTIRASRFRANASPPEKTGPEKSTVGLLANIVRDVVAGETFETFADLTDAVKSRCARLRVTWTNDAISEAYRLVGSNRPLVAPDPRMKRRTPNVERLDDAITLRADAAAILRRLARTVRTMPSLSETERVAIRETKGQYFTREELRVQFEGE